MHTERMAKTWLSITVELLGGRGIESWPHPGRIFAVGPSHTFNDLAQSINTAFARWDFNHINEFMLSEGTVITDPEMALEMLAEGSGPVLRPLNIYTTKVARTVRAGDEFQFTFDLGDNWVHRCTVAKHKVDPYEVLGARPTTPAAYWGWGAMPDQYGRRWADDSGEDALAKQPQHIDPMLSHEWPRFEQLPAEALQRARTAITANDGGALFNAIVGYNIDEHLTELAQGAHLFLTPLTEQGEALTLSFVNRLSWRGKPGDDELADQLLTLLRETSSQ